MKKINIKIIAVNFYKYVLKFRIVNWDDSEIFECHFINSENNDFVNSYQTDFFIVNRKELKFYRYGKLEIDELKSLWHQIEDVYSKTTGQEIITD